VTEGQKHGFFLSPAPRNHLALNVQNNFQRVKILVRETAQIHPSNAEGKNDVLLSVHHTCTLPLSDAQANLRFEKEESMY
jgi:hypothetical protein